MFKVYLEPQAYHKIDSYIISYSNYFERLFQDSWVWEESTIISNYCIESEERYFQILKALELKLSNPIISYSNNEAIIKWRSKILLVSFREKWDTRTITHIEIR